MDLLSWTPIIPLARLLLHGLRSSATSRAEKNYNCQCGRRMSSLTSDFHSVCIVCRGVDCDIDRRCIECTDVNNNVMTMLNIS